MQRQLVKETQKSRVRGSKRLTVTSVFQIVTESQTSAKKNRDIYKETKTIELRTCKAKATRRPRK